MMRLPDFTYRPARTVREAVEALADGGPEATVMAGGTDLVPNMKRKHQTPRHLIGLRGVEAMYGIRSGKDGWTHVGPNMVLTDVHDNPRIRELYPALATAAMSISTPILRNMGTIGGNICLDTRCTYYNQNLEWRRSIDYCMKKEGSICWVAPSSPRCWAISASDTAPILSAIGARVKIESRAGERVIPIHELYNNDGIAYLTKKRDELITDILLPPTNGWRASFLKLRRRGAIDFSVLNVGAWADFAADGTVKEARIFLGAVSSYPIPVPVDAIVGTKLNDDAIARAADAAYAPAKPLDNTDFAMTWRKKMVREYVRRALLDLRSPRAAGSVS